MKTLRALAILLAVTFAGCGGQLLPEGSLPAPLDVSDAGAADVALTTAPSGARLPACVWVHPAGSFTCAADAREILADGGGFCACEPSTACEALEVGPGQDSGGEGSRVVGCAFRPRTDGGAP